MSADEHVVSFKHPGYPPEVITTLALLITAASSIRFFGISYHPMYDDAISWTLTQLSCVSFWKVIWNYDANMIFYYLLLRVWVNVGTGETVLRSLSVFFGVLTIPAIYDLGYRLFNRRIGLLAAVLISLHSFHVYWSQQARSYSLTTLLLVLSTSLLVSALQAQQTKKTWVTYVIVSALACYCHVLAVLVLISQWIWVVITAGYQALRTKINALLWLASLIAPLGLYVVIQDNGQVDWIPPLTGSRFMKIITSLAGGTEFAEPKGTSLLFLSMALCIVGSHSGLRRRKSFNSANTLVVIWLLFPTGALTLVSLHKPLLVDRYLLMCVPALTMLVAFALDGLLGSEHHWLRRAGLVAGLTICGLSSWLSFAQYRAVVTQGNPFRDMTEYILARQQPADAVLFFTSQARMSFNFYASHAPSNQSRSLPKAAIPNSGDVPSASPSVEEVRKVSKEYRAVWLVLNLTSINLTSARQAAVPVIWSTLLEEFDLLDKQQIGNFLVCRFVRKW